MTVQSAAATATASTVRPAGPSFAMRSRLALLTLVAVYPLITGLVYLVGAFTETWPAWERNFIVAPLMVIAMIYVIIPTIQSRFGRFIATGKL